MLNRYMPGDDRYQETYRSLKCDSDSAKYGTRCGRALETIVDSGVVRSGICRNTRGADAGGIAEQAVSCVASVEHVLHGAENLEASVDPVGGAQAQHVISGHGRILIGFIAMVVLGGHQHKGSAHGPVAADRIVGSGLETLPGNAGSLIP